MADAKANQSVYKRMAAKLGSANTGTGAINPATSTPPAVPSRKKADISNGKSLYPRKVALPTVSSGKNTINDKNQSTSKKSLPYNSGKTTKTHFAD